MAAMALRVGRSVRLVSSAADNDGKDQAMRMGGGDSTTLEAPIHNSATYGMGQCSRQISFESFRYPAISSAWRPLLYGKAKLW